MSLLWDYLKRKGNSIVVPRSASAPRIDGSLPLKIKVGSLVSIEPTPVILAQAAGLLVDQPVDRQPVIAYGHFPYAGRHVHRFYLEDKHLLQAVVDGGGAIQEIMLYRHYDEYRPQEGELGNWLLPEKQPIKPNDSAVIGYKEYNLFDAETHQKVLATYARSWGNRADGGPDQAKPEVFTEFLFVQPYEGKSMRVRQSTMMYSRQPPTPAAYPQGIEISGEYVMIECTELPDDTVIQWYVGIPIPATEDSIKVIWS